uniref:Uncharacterized protein n=1 Tax=Lygus hesperus TaxID=30085 RepID=A0A0A9YA44_LYGHE
MELVATTTSSASLSAISSSRRQRLLKQQQQYQQKEGSVFSSFRVDKQLFATPSQASHGSRGAVLRHSVVSTNPNNLTSVFRKLRLDSTPPYRAHAATSLGPVYALGGEEVNNDDDNNTISNSRNNNNISNSNIVGSFSHP